jgi:nicotinate phosphoribosyltransferase
MNGLAQLYRPSLALLTDLYQLTMAYGYWKAGVAEHEAAFHLFFRSNPFEGGFSVACGLARALDFVEALRFEDPDLDYLAGLEGNDGRPLFDAPFLEHLHRLELRVDIDAMPEGTVAFAREPLVRVRGPILHCQLLETPLLNAINFETLIATKAARVSLATAGEPVLEFGLRRAQGIDGGLAASRAAYVGGCSATSNVLAGRLYGIPVAGTHAHSWVMAFDTEREAFLAWARAMPNNCVFLVDTYDTLDGVTRAVETGRWLREQGHEMVGIRLDSGDLAYLSVEARRILDEGGFPNAAIVASNDLDESVIASLKSQGAAIGVWGVGTRLVTGHDQPALGGVYKLSAVRRPGGPWQHRLKLSEQQVKVSIPGLQQVRRFRDATGCVADMIYDEDQPLAPGPQHIVDPADSTRRKTLASELAHEDLLIPVVRAGTRVYSPPPPAEARARTHAQLASFHAGIKRFLYPHRYPVGLEAGLNELRTRLMLEIRGIDG